MFESKLEEGQVYEMSYFSVFPQVGSYRTTLHPHKYVFKKKDNNIVDDVKEIESESTVEIETGIESKNCSISRESEDENELEEGEIVDSDVSVNDDSEDDS
jgi:hypothetical protein